MTEERFKLTNENVRTRCVAPAPGETNARGKPVRQRLYWDADLRGFGLLVGTQSKSFIVQRDLPGGRTVRATIGRFPTWTADQARKRARELIVEMDKGTDPNAAARAKAAKHKAAEWETFTLAQAMEEHIATMKAKACAPRSMLQVRDEVGRLLGDWLPKPLVSIRRKDCIERHRKITADSGPVAANRVLKMLRACWNSAARLYEELPPHPVVGVVFNKQKRRRQPIPWADLPEWWQKVRTLPNPVRRDLNLLMLFTGLRATDACTVRWEHLDFAKGTVHRPKPKGGEDKAFTVPLPRFILRLLARRRLANIVQFPDGDDGWVFPTVDRAGKVKATSEPKEQRWEYGVGGAIKKTFHLPTPHRLRDTFATACLEAGVGHTETKILLNHSLPNADVTMGHQRPSTAHLRACTEKVAAFLLSNKRSPRL